MKNILPILIISVLVFDCAPKEKGLEQLWIKKYVVQQAGSEEERIIDWGYAIYEFDKDSVAIKSFSTDFIYFFTAIKKSKFPYAVVADTLIVYQDNSIDTMKYQLLADTLKLEFDLYFPQLVFYERLEEYHQAKKEQAFRKMLLSSSFEIDSVSIEFQEDGRLIIADFDDGIGEVQHWMLDKYKDELFLIMEGFDGFLLHITAINDSGFKGLVYAKENKDVVFKKSPKNKRFNSADLLGNWLEYVPEGLPLPPSPPSPPLPQHIEQEVAFPERERLSITDTLLLKSQWYRTDTMRWSSNRAQDWIIFPKPAPHRSSQWKIVSLNDQELVLERKVYTGTYPFTRQEHVRRETRFVRE